MVVGRRPEALPIEVLKTIVAVSETANYRIAASRLGISNSAVSSQLERVKRIVGADVFKREQDTLVTTDAGGQVVSIARRILDLYEELFEIRHSI